MSIIIHAIYEGGVFRPTEAVEIPERSEVEVEVRVVKEGPPRPTLDDVYAILSERFDSGEHDVAGPRRAPVTTGRLVLPNTVKFLHHTTAYD